jgi:hypothetical protein|tara:strand:- start:6574 stop:8169 length:1596 start_codon:yes stop_codon:yes gene_type:complete
MLIITSAAYIPSELVADLGQLPPSFLPIRNRRLYHHQLQSLEGLDEKIVLTLPSDFELDGSDEQQLASMGARIIRTEPALPLQQSLLEVMQQCHIPLREPVRILHGDTLQRDLPLADVNVVSVAANEGYYPRALVKAAGNQFLSADYRYCRPGDLVLTGYMCFGDASLFQSLLQEGLNLFELLNSYEPRGGRPLVVIKSTGWSDCGHVNAYYRSRASHTAERVFNELKVERHYIRKRGKNAKKIQAELDWFNNVPPSLRHSIPQIGSFSTDPENTFYDIEYLYSLPLSDLYVFGRLPVEDWRIIFQRCADYLSECAAYPKPSGMSMDWRRMYMSKTEARLQVYAGATGWEIDGPTYIDDLKYPSLLEMASSAQQVIDAAPEARLSMFHGDFCFSNILYDARARRIKVIDPRGLAPDGLPSIYGDIRYDIGKLYHSVVGGYDFVLAGLISANADGQNRIRMNGQMPLCTNPIIDAFRQICLKSVDRSGNEALISAIAVHLFLSMLPLHDDDAGRQLSLISRAIALYSLIKSR